MAGHRRLKTLHDCRRYLAYLVNQVEKDKISATKAGRLTYIVNILKSTIIEAEKRGGGEQINVIIHKEAQIIEADDNIKQITHTESADSD